jgi:polyhydroxyalkanoate synthesis regulator phasin
MLIKEMSSLQNKELKQEYRKLILKYHPDNKISGDEEMIKKINAAAEEGDESFKEFLNSLENKKEERKASNKINNFEMYNEALKIFKVKAAKLASDSNLKIEVSSKIENLKPVVIITISKFLKSKTFYVTDLLDSFVKKGKIDETVINRILEEVISRFNKTREKEKV